MTAKEKMHSGGLYLPGDEEIMAEQAYRLIKDKNLHIQESQWTLNRINSGTHMVIHCNQTFENQRQIENFESSKRCDWLDLRNPQ